MSWYDKNRFDNLRAESISESTVDEINKVLNNKEEIVPSSVNDGIDLLDEIEKEGLTEAAYVDSLLEALE